MVLHYQYVKTDSYREVRAGGLTFLAIDNSRLLS